MGDERRPQRDVLRPMEEVIQLPFVGHRLCEVDDGLAPPHVNLSLEPKVCRRKLHAERQHGLVR